MSTAVYPLPTDAADAPATTRDHQCPPAPHSTPETRPADLAAGKWHEKRQARRRGAQQTGEKPAVGGSAATRRHTPPTSSPVLTSVATLVQQVGHDGASQALIVHEEHVHTGSRRRRRPRSLYHWAVWAVHRIIHGHRVSHGPTHGDGGTFCGGAPRVTGAATPLKDLYRRGRELKTPGLVKDGQGGREK